MSTAHSIPSRWSAHCQESTDDLHLMKETQLMQVNHEARRQVTSDCASRMNHWSRRNAACLLVQGDTALLVKVPYGSAPGWDFPGGRKKSDEYACQTAERETCEETGYQVRAIEKLSYNVFRCEVVRKGACRKPVDEGFLRKKWWPRGELGSLNYRRGTWGDKRALLYRHVGKSKKAEPSTSRRLGSEILDVCGCNVCRNQGFSSRRNQCAYGSYSDPGEACACVKQSKGSDGVDSCGCRPCLGEGWSSSRGRCVQNAETDAREACDCERRRAGLVQAS